MLGPPYAGLGPSQGACGKPFAFQPFTPAWRKKHFLYVVSVAKLFVHNGKLKFHFHMKLVNNGFQDSLNKHAQDTVSILSLSTGRRPSGWKVNQLWSYFGGLGCEAWGGQSVWGL